MNLLVCEQLSERLFNLEERAGNGTAVNAYLYCGSRSAILIDTLEQCRGLYEAVRQITDLPLTVLFTHVHPDHIGVATEEFVSAGAELYVADADLPYLAEMCPWAKEAWFSTLNNGAVFDLGDRRLKTIFLPGHTPGSAVFLDSENGLLFSGDAIGSGGFWMQLANARPLDEFYKNTAALYEQVKDIGGLSILVSHRWQKPQPTGFSYLQDVIETTEKILIGELKGREETVVFGGKMIPYLTASHGQMLSFCYDPNRIYGAERE